MIRILGVDPGSQIAGYGIIESDGYDYRHIHHGLMRLPIKKSFAQRMESLYSQLQKCVQEHRPQAFVLESIFLGKSVDSAFKLGHVRGVCLLVAAQYQLSVDEYAPRKVKKVVTGHGAADKEQVKLMVAQLLGIRTELRHDATDALALAMTHAVKLKERKMMERQL